MAHRSPIRWAGPRPGLVGRLPPQEAGQRRSLRQGSATIEFAILLPIFMTVALLCVDFGRFVNTYIAVTNAAGVGAAFGSFHPVIPATKAAWDAQIRQAIEDELTGNPWFDPALLTVPTPDAIDEGSGFRRVRVEVQYPFQTLINWPFLGGYNNPLILRRVVVMRGIR